MYNRSTREYDKVKIDLSIVTGVRLMSRRNIDMDAEKTAVIVCEVA